MEVLGIYTNAICTCTKETYLSEESICRKPKEIYRCQYTARIETALYSRIFEADSMPSCSQSSNIPQAD